jgi:predicted ATPase
MWVKEGARRFSGLRYLFIDEFELDDPGNAQMATHFLALTMDKGLRVATTSNTRSCQDVCVIRNPSGAFPQGRARA